MSPGAQPGKQFSSGRRRGPFGRKQTPAGEAFLLGNTVERRVQRDLFIAR